MRVLDVWLLDSLAGRLSQSSDGGLAFAYDGDYLTQGSAQAISVSMPLREELYDDRLARPYFSGLLPDERARRQLAAALGVSEGNAFGLLEIIGGECAGALSLLPPGEALPPPGAQQPEAVSPVMLADLLERLRSRPLLAGDAGVRLSLAGAQDKLAVCLVDGQVALAGAGRPTTHILKPFIEGLSGTVENELFCMRLANAVGLPAPMVDEGSVDGIDFFLVERYDRTVDDQGVIHRLHQEDFCQALAIPPELKCEEEGGPGAEDAQSLIARCTQRPAADRLAFLRFLIFHYLVGNTDAHAKNFALLYRGKVPELAPLYDVLCTAAYPQLSRRMAMSIGGRSIPDTIHLTHWQALVPGTRVARRQLEKELGQLCSAVVENAVTLVQDMREQGTNHAILDRILQIIETRTRHVQSVLSI